MIGSIFVEGLLLGFSLGTSCLVTCLPVVLPLLLSEHGLLHKGFRDMFWFLLGRFAGYIGFGAFLGAIGGALPLSVRTLITSIAYILLGGLLILQVFKKSKNEESCQVTRFRNITSHPAIFGLLVGINPCPAFLLTLSRAVDSGGALAGIILFTGFFVSTTIFFLPIGAFAGLGRVKIVQWISKIIALIVGLWFLGNGIISLAYNIIAPQESNLEVVEIFDTDTVFLAGEGDLLLYFKDIFEFDGELIPVKAESTPDFAWLIVFDEKLDTVELLSRGVNVIRVSADSTSAVRAAKLLSSHAFKRQSERGFYYWIE